MNSWELFDTLIARRWVDSSWIWAAIEQHTAIVGFAQKRVELDNGTRTLSEIYRELGNSALQEIEEELEVRNCFPVRANMRRVQHGDVIISDTYLEVPVLSRMLHACDLDKQVTIYASNSDKHTGIAWQKFKPRVHVGDNQHSDVAMPSMAGITAQHYPGTAFMPPESRLPNMPLACLMREIRLSTESDEWSDSARNLNLPFLSIFCELIRRKVKKPVFLGRDCQLTHTLYSAYCGESYYVPFSREAAGKDPHGAIEYLRSRMPSGGTLVDLSSTGATWEFLATLGGAFEVLVGFYSDLYHYTPHKPTLPSNFSFLTNATRAGQTREMLEVLNCADHGKLTSVSRLHATFAEPELSADLICSIHMPIRRAVELRQHYAERIQEDFGGWTDEQLIDLLGILGIEISNQDHLFQQIRGVWR